MGGRARNRNVYPRSAERKLKVWRCVSICDSTGNLVDALDDRDAAVAALTDIVRAEPEPADEVFLVARVSEAARSPRGDDRKDGAE